MHVLLIGASGMVGQAALAACLRDPGVEQVTALVRSPLGIQGGKVREVVCTDLLAITSVLETFPHPDVCLFCAGVSAVGKSEAEYRRLTYELTLAVARALVQLSPPMHFLYVSGDGTDSTEKGRAMWARVKGATENSLLRLGFASVALFRPGYIQPLDGVRSKVGWYRLFYAVLRPLYPLLRRVSPNHVTDSDTLGRAMLRVVEPGAQSAIYDSAAINRIGKAL